MVRLPIHKEKESMGKEQRLFNFPFLLTGNLVNIPLYSPNIPVLPGKKTKTENTQKHHKQMLLIVSAPNFNFDITAKTFLVKIKQSFLWFSQWDIQTSTD